MSYAHEWRKPGYITFEDNTNWIILSVNSLLVISMIPVIIYQQYRLRHVCRLVLLLQQTVPSEARDFLVLTTPLLTTPAPGRSYHEYVSSFSLTNTGCIY